MTNVALVLGALELINDPTKTFFALGDDFSWGEPDVVVSSVQGQLMDGEFVTHVRDGNRTIVRPVMVTGRDVADLDDAEALLTAEVHKAQNTLLVKGVGENTTPSVFDIFRGSMREVSNDIAEMHDRPYRVYVLTFPAWPYARTEDPVVVPALSVVTGTTIVSDGSSTSGWTIGKFGGSGFDPTLSAVSGALRVSQAYASDNGTPLLSKTAPVAITTHKFVSVLVKNPALADYGIPEVKLVKDNVWSYYPVAAQQMESDGSRRLWFGPILGSSLNLRLAITGYRGVEDPHVWDIDEVRLDGGLPGSDSGNAQMRSVTIQGSVRTSASIEVAKPAGANLGATVVMCRRDWGDGFRPDLRSLFYTSGGTAALGAAFGADYLYAGTDPIQFVLPTTGLREGAYAVVGFGKIHDGTLEFPVSTRVITCTAAIDGGATAQSARRVPVDEVGNFQTLGVLHLPPSPIYPGAQNTVTLEISGETTVSEVWLVPLDSTTYFINNDPTAAPGSQSRLWIEPPSAALPRGGVWSGSQADRSDAVSVMHRLRSFGPCPEFAPKTTIMHVATNNVTDVEVSASYYPKGHTHAPAIRTV